MLRELLENASIIEIVATLVAIGLIISSILCLFYIIFGGITFTLSAGNEEKIKKATYTIRFSIFGLFISFLAFFAVAFLAKMLDIPFDLSFSLIADLMREIMDAFQ